MVAQNQERIPNSNDNHSGITRTTASTFDGKGERGGKKTGFIQRQRQLTGAGFVQALIFGQLAHRQATRRQLHQKLLCTGECISCQGLDKRFNRQAEAFLQAMLAEVLCQQASSQLNDESLLAGFNGVYVVDSTTLAQGVKLLTCLNLSNAGVTFEVADSRTHDNAIALAQAPLPPGALRLADLGFFDLAAFAAYTEAGVYWLSRYKARTHLLSADTQQPLDLHALLSRHDQLYCPVLVGEKARLKAYLVARRLSPQHTQSRQQRRAERAQRKQHTLSQATLALAGWDIFLTNIPPVSVDAICALARARWQVEVVFKLWKSFWGVEQPQSGDPLRQRCLFFAKLLALWVSHCLLSLDPHTNHSWWQAAQFLRDHAVSALYALASFQAWHDFLMRLASLLPCASRMSKRKAQPLTFQWLTFVP
jgi:hypothetical protein